MNAALQTRPGSQAIRIDVTLPVTRFGAGPFSFDPLAQMIGAPVADLLEPLRVGPILKRPSPSGAAVEVHPLALPEGEGLTVPLGQFGEIGFANRKSLLVLTLPRGIAGWVQLRMGKAVVSGPVIVPSLDGSATVAEITVRLHRGMRVGIPVGLFGEVGVEAG